MRLCALLGLLAFLAAGPAARAQGPAPSGALEVPARPVWAGEVFDLGLAWRVHWSSFQNLDGEPVWEAAPLVAEPWGPPALAGPPVDGWATIRRTSRAMALQPGRVALAPARQTIVVQTGVVEMEEYRRAVTGPVTVSSSGAVLAVRPLPPAPQGFSGAVGRFSVASSVDRRTLAVGDSLTWTVELRGEGNWPAIQGLPPRQASRDFEVVGEPKLAEAAGATLFERTLSETVVLAPQRAGRYVLGAFEVVAFDPGLGRYVTLRAPPIELIIEPGPLGDLAPGATVPAGPAREDALPPMLKGEGRALAPPATWVWAGGLALAPLALAALWLGLALRRAWLDDPHRAARRAHARLQRTLAAMAQVDGPPDRRLVRDWQKDVAVRLGLGRAAPTPAAFREQPAWGALWAEAETFLYGREGVLRADWARAAAGVFAELEAPPPFRPAAALRPASLLPMALVGLALLAAAAPAALADPPNTEAALRAAVDARPLDWRARHNLAVVLAAQERWDEAAGHAAAGWIQQPGAPQARALWLRTAAKAGYSLEPRTGVPRPRGAWLGFVTRASPAAWRWTALAAAWLVALGLAAVLLARHGRGGKGLRRAGPVLFALGVATAGTAAAALLTYGPLSNPRAVVVWKAGPLRPLPVETPAETVAVQLPAGAVGQARQSFLGWRRVRLGDGRSGWVRRENLVWIWTAPQ